MLRLRPFYEELASCPGLREKDVQTLREWAKKQAHLPNLDELPGDTASVLLAMILKRRYNSIERAKETLDNYFTFRDLAPELSFNRNIKRPELQTYFSMNYTMMMDKRDSEGNVVLFQYLHDPALKGYDGVISILAILMVIEAWIYENGSGGAPGLTFVFDQRNFSLTHLATVPMSTIKKLNHFNKDCTPISVKNIYVVNTTNFIQAMLALIKPFVQGELFQKIKSFTPQQMEELYERVPREAVPNEFGGTAGSLEDLDRISVKRLERCQEVFQKFDSVHVDESKRTGPQKNAHSMFGLEGSFKRLDVD